MLKASAVIPPKMQQSAELYSQPIPRYVSSAHYATNQCHLLLYSEMSSEETEEHLGVPQHQASTRQASIYRNKPLQCHDGLGGSD